MMFQKNLTHTDIQLAQRLKDFIPGEIFDIHVHPYHATHFPPGEWAFLQGENQLGCRDHVHYLQRYMPSANIHALYFGLPRVTADRDAINQWIATEVTANASPLSRSLLLASPVDDPGKISDQLKNGIHCGIKVYHCYANRPDTMNAGITEYAPEWMWELLHGVSGVLLLHIVKHGAIEDADNQQQLKRLCKAYPKVKLILAHVARSFNYRNARAGLNAIAGIENLVLDTSAICETESFKAALKILGPRRILWGSDFPISEMRGRSVSTGDGFHWVHPAAAASNMTLIGIESLLTLKESCDDLGLNQEDINDIFFNNAVRWLQPHLPATAAIPAINSRQQWQSSRQVISGGTGLLSKRSEQYNADWPAFFSRSAGCEVWDMNGKRYVDCAGGIGAVLLGYADEDVTKAVTRRLTLGTYASLVNPQETELAEKLLHLHPWAGKVRYARTGGEAMAVAVRIARAASGKSGVAFCGYHGWHDWYLAANLAADNALDGHLLPGLQPKGVPRELAGTSVPFKYNDWPSFENAVNQLAGNFGVVVMEPMRSQFPQDDFLHKVRILCARKNAVLVVDEITSGLRYGYPGALARYSVEPDIVVYAKAMGNGLPFAAVVGTHSVMDAADDSFISSSYWTDGVGTAAALAVLQKMEAQNVFESVWSKGELFQQQLRVIAARYPMCGLVVGGMPASPTFTFASPAYGAAAKQLYINKMQAAGFLVSGIFYLMLSHQAHHLQHFLSCFDETLSFINDCINKGDMTADNGSGFQHGFTRLA